MNGREIFNFSNKIKKNDNSVYQNFKIIIMYINLFIFNIKNYYFAKDVMPKYLWQNNNF